MKAPSNGQNSESLPVQALCRISILYDGMVRDEQDSARESVTKWLSDIGYAKS